MRRDSQSGNEPDRRQWEPEWPERSEPDVRASAATPDAPGDPTDWIASLPDFDENGPKDGRVSQAPGAGHEWLQLPDPDLHWEVDTQTQYDNTVAAAEGVPADLKDWTSAASRGATGTAAAFGGKPPRKHSPPIVAIVAAIGVLFLGGAVGLIAVTGRGGDTKPKSRAEIEKATGTTARVTTATTVAPSTSASVASAPSPASFTVHSTCGGRDCSIVVRDGPGKANYQNVGALRAGQSVQIDCLTHGELVKDSDSGDQSDVWYRQAATKNYVSALYLVGPTVPDCVR